MKKIISIIPILIFLISCNNDDDASLNPNNDIPKIQTEAKYRVSVTDGITYAEGLSHETINSANSTQKPLLLDAFVPENNLEARPAIVLIHGGGFIGGSRKDPNIVNLANYFAARGWVAFSIDYRLKGDIGTVPEEWVQYGQNNLDVATFPVFLSLYPAQRDAKSALRWVKANAKQYNINTDYITVGGGSAGAITAIALGISNQEDFTKEISENVDPTLANTNKEQDYKVHSIINFWGSKVALDALQDVYGHQRFDVNDPPMLIIHGTEDSTVPFSNAEDLRDEYSSLGIDHTFYQLEGRGHGPWNATVNGKKLEELAFDFVLEHQNLIVE